LFERFHDALEGRFPAQWAGLQPWVPGRSEGVLLGGNLTVLSALLGTPYFPPLTEAVLFLEDIGERPYRVDRMLTSLRNAGVLAAVRGIALGAFVDGAPGADSVSVEAVLLERLADLGIPIVAGVPAGHLEDNAELPFGRRVALDAAAGTMAVI
jgi:muramoyltetrapeptide carboxypeptidase